MMQLPVCLIRPAYCSRAAKVQLYVAMLLEGKVAPAIFVFEDCGLDNRPYRFRIIEGCHRFAAAVLFGLATIAVRVISR